MTLCFSHCILAGGIWFQIVPLRMMFTWITCLGGCLSDDLTLELLIFEVHKYYLGSYLESMKISLPFQTFNAFILYNIWIHSFCFCSVGYNPLLSFILMLRLSYDQFEIL